MNPMDLAAALIADDRQLPLDLVFAAQEQGLFADGDYQAAYDRMMDEALEADAEKLAILMADEPTWDVPELNTDHDEEG